MISRKDYDARALDGIRPFELLRDHPNFKDGTPYPFISRRRFMWLVDQTEALLAGKASCSMLSAGCFPGSLDRILKALHGSRLSITGTGLAIDEAFEKSMLGPVYDRICKVELDPRHPDNLSQALPNKIPLPNRSIDIAVAGEIIEHLYSPLNFIAELARVLKPGGSLLLTTPNISYIGNIIRLLRGKSCHESLETSHIFLKSEWRAHIRVYSPEELRQLFAREGLFQRRLDLIDSEEEKLNKSARIRLQMTLVKPFYVFPRYRNCICQVFAKREREAAET